MNLHHANRRDSGFVLVMALLLIVLLTAVLMEFNYECRVHAALADNVAREARVAFAANAGIEIARALLTKHERLLDDKELAPLVNGSRPFQVGEGYVTIRLTPESGKINVNLLKTKSGQLLRHRVDQMLRLCDLLNQQYGERAPVGYGIVPAMIDWTDADDDVTIFPFVAHENEGAEDEYYRRLQPPLRCKNAPFDSVTEILFIRGVTREIFDGRQNAKPVPGLKDLVTVYGDGAIDLNYAPPLVLQSLSEHLDAITVQEIVRRREAEPFKSAAALQDVPGMTPKLLAALVNLVAIGGKESYYTVDAVARIAEKERVVRAVLRREASGRVSVAQYLTE